MAKVTAVRISQNASVQKTKAAQLEALATSIKTQMLEVDSAIYELVNAGIEGTAIQAAAGTYIKNREVISGFVKRFAAAALVLDSGADAMAKLNADAEANATAN